ncbi:MAG: sigma-70 family RNA polymerase sigma factor [Anaerolineales bacterium]
MNPNSQASNYLFDMKVSPPLSDLELIRQIAAEDTNALEELYQRYHKTLFNFFLRTTHESASSEDLLQELFFAVWEGAAKFEGRASVKTWLLRIAHYMAAGWIRNTQKEFEDINTFDIDTSEIFPEQDELSLESQAFLKLTYAQIQKAIEQLTPRQREIIEFSFSYGLSHSEISYILDCPVGTVKSRLHTAIRQLQRIISAKGITL